MPKSGKSSISSEKLATFLMLFAPLAIIFIFFESRLGGLKHGMHQSSEAGHFVPMPIATFDGEDQPFDLDMMDED